ncbi:hypothetical protein DIPPA_08630 [Diplonema papillatum]|nr:hypothetical protein DIPPA_08630 [Diplonema papillatum]
MGINTAMLVFIIAECIFVVAMVACYVVRSRKRQELAASKEPEFLKDVVPPPAVEADHNPDVSRQRSHDQSVVEMEEDYSEACGDADV